MRRVLLALLIAVGLGGAAAGIASALMGDTDTVPANTLSADTLDPPMGLNALGGNTVSLSWTATVDTYAAGYRILRATVSGGPYSQIAQITPRTNTMYVDDPGAGTFYYVVRSYYQNWESLDSGEDSATVSCTAGSTGFLSPTAEAADTGGDGDGFELNPTNAFADDTAFASNINGAGDRHRYHDYGLAVPAACSVAGIEVRLDWWLDGDDGLNYLFVELSWDGGASWVVGKRDTTETTTEHTATLGGAADDWGRTWSPSEFSDANFRVLVTARCGGSEPICGGRDYFLDWVPVSVTYD